MSSEYFLQQPSVDILNVDNWITLLRSAATNIGTLLLLAVLSGIIYYVLSKVDERLAAISVPFMVLAAQMFCLTWFEYWDGCYKKKSDLYQ
jgi:inner membrane protein involved in colicin E2 resistance